MAVTRLLRTPLGLVILLLTALGASSVRASGLDDTAGVLRVALPVAALSYTWYVDDPEGRRQWALSTATTLATAYALKQVVSKQRPDGSGDDAFVSGHAAAAFSGAAFLQRRYGAQVGVPAYALASWTAWSRVRTDAHDEWDVLGAAVLAIGSAYWLVDERKNLSVMPYAGAGSVGVQFRVVF